MLRRVGCGSSLPHPHGGALKLGGTRSPMRSSGDIGSSVVLFLKNGEGSTFLSFRCWGWWDFCLCGGGLPPGGWRVTEGFLGSLCGGVLPPPDGWSRGEDGLSCRHGVEPPFTRSPIPPGWVEGDVGFPCVSVHGTDAFLAPQWKGHPRKVQPLSWRKVRRWSFSLHLVCMHGSFGAFSG